MVSGIFEKTVTILNQRGIHARAAAKFVKLVESYQADVTVRKDDMQVTGTSIMGLLMLSASMHATVHLKASGRDAEKVLLELVGLIERRFDEE